MGGVTGGMVGGGGVTVSAIQCTDGLSLPSQNENQTSSLNCDIFLCLTQVQGGRGTQQFRSRKPWGTKVKIEFFAEVRIVF